MGRRQELPFGRYKSCQNGSLGRWESNPKIRRGFLAANHTSNYFPLRYGLRVENGRTCRHQSNETQSDMLGLDTSDEDSYRVAYLSPFSWSEGRSRTGRCCAVIRSASNCSIAARSHAPTFSSGTGDASKTKLGLIGICVYLLSCA